MAGLAAGAAGAGLTPGAQTFSDEDNQCGHESMVWSTRVTIPKKQEYGATLNRGAVTVTLVSNGRAAVCVTEGPRVDGWLLYK